MTRGTTPTVRFWLPMEASILSELAISFSQRGVEKFSVDTSRCTLEDKLISVKLTQSETLKLESGIDVEMQIRALVEETGEAIASDIMTAAVRPVLKEGVIE